ALQERIEQFRIQKEVMKSQMAAAQAQVKVTESLTGLGHGLDDAGDALRRVQDRTAHEQAKAQAMDGLLESGVINDPLDHRTQTDREMDKLRATSGVDDDLARLKAELAAKQD
ncbi:MAG: PspA/IM30 family protein, partial [Acidithiobacillus sp.]